MNPSPSEIPNHHRNERERTRSRASDICAPPAYQSTTEGRSPAAAALGICRASRVFWCRVHQPSNLKTLNIRMRNSRGRTRSLASDVAAPPAYHSTTEGRSPAAAAPSALAASASVRA